ncbi:hypothetical protein Droror1_Dr00009262 [Drosera rotundifolia]
MAAKTNDLTDLSTMEGSTELEAALKAIKELAVLNPDDDEFTLEEFNFYISMWSAYKVITSRVYGNWNYRIRDTVISMINLERNGTKIDRDLIKNVLAIYIELAGNGSLANYRKDFEEAMLKATAESYRLKVMRKGLKANPAKLDRW